MIKHGIEYQRPTSLNMRILADHVTYSFLAFMKSKFFIFAWDVTAGGILRTGVLICLVLPVVRDHLSRETTKFSGRLIQVLLFMAFQCQQWYAQSDQSLQV